MKIENSGCCIPNYTGKGRRGLKVPCYIGLEQAREVLAEMGVELISRQMKRAADKVASGRRKLQFFVYPIEGKLNFEKGTLVEIYMTQQNEAENSEKD
jgi:hypothetical protein